MLRATTASRTAVAVSGRAAPFALPVLRLKPTRSVVARYKDEKVQDVADTLNKKKDETVEAGQRAGQKAQNGLQDLSSKAGSIKEQVSDVVRNTVAGTPQVAQFDAQFKVNPLVPAFTRRREVFSGRLAMIGFTAACLWETYLPSHANVVQQISYFTEKAGIPFGPGAAMFSLAVLLGYNTLGGLGPWSPTFSRENQEDVAKRPKGPPSEWVSPVDFKRFFGFTSFGFTKANEVFNGRMAMIGFFMALVNQWRLGGFDGPGPIAQVWSVFGQMPDYDLIASQALFLTTLAFGLSIATGNRGTLQGEEEIY